MFGGRLSQDEVGMNWALLGVEGDVSARVWPARVGGGGQRGAAPLGRLLVQVPPPAAVPGKGTWSAQDKVWGVEDEWELCVWLALLLGSAPSSVLGQFWPGFPGTRLQQCPPPPGAGDAVQGDTPWGARGLMSVQPSRSPVRQGRRAGLPRS